MKTQDAVGRALPVIILSEHQSRTEPEEDKCGGRQEVKDITRKLQTPADNQILIDRYEDAWI